MRAHEDERSSVVTLSRKTVTHLRVSKYAFAIPHPGPKSCIESPPVFGGYRRLTPGISRDVCQIGANESERTR